jgi:hypothetical protein
MDYARQQARGTDSRLRLKLGAYEGRGRVFAGIDDGETMKITVSTVRVQAPQRVSVALIVTRRTARVMLVARVCEYCFDYFATSSDIVAHYKTAHKEEEE